jgi:hypothetical protein
MQFADHVQRHLFRSGALMSAPAAERFQRWADEIDKAVVAESARWGDYRRDFHRYKTGPYEFYTRDEHWRPEIKRLLAEYFPQRTAVVLKQFQAAGLYPNIEAPSGRRVDGRLILSAPRGVIYFTKDESDPRVTGGKIATGALKYEGTIVLEAGRRIKARALAGSAASPEWSALVEF